MPKWAEDAIGVVLGVIIVLGLVWWSGVLPDLVNVFRRLM
jgi:hypothetical protein